MAAGNIWDNGLVQLQTATLLAVNRWQYEFVPYYPSNQTGLSDIITTLPSHTRFSNQVAYNLREMFNTAIYADNMDLTNPPSSIGPVGSRYNAGTSLARIAVVRCGAFVGGVRQGRQGVPVLRQAEPDPVRKRLHRRGLNEHAEP